MSIGDTGATGATGDAGAAGERGQDGFRGDRGERGDRGVGGERGPKGDHGQAGDQGLEGKAGAPGRSFLNFTKLQLTTFLLVVLVSLYGLFQSFRAIDIVRNADIRGNLISCNNENDIRRDSNLRDSRLEDTASLVKDALAVLDDTPGADKIQLAQIKERAEQIQTNFPPSKLEDCRQRFPRPE